MELCGGTHISNTARIGLFKIISESSVAAGVRRIEAATGANVLELIRQDEALLARTCESLKAGSPSELPQKAEAITAQLKEKEKEIETLQHKIADMRIEGLFENAMEVKGCKVIFAGFTGTSPDAVKAMCDQVRANAPKMVAVFASILGEKATVFAACGDEAVKKGAHAGNLIRQLTAKLGGKGGGRPEQAQGGVADIFKIDEALAEIPTMLEKMIQDYTKEVFGMDCLFCKIIAGEIPSKTVYEDAEILAFCDIQPQAPVHVLVIPKEHIPSVDGITAENSDVVAHIFQTIPKIAASLGLTGGYRVISNCGADAGQTVPHLHFHIMGGKPLSLTMA